MAKTGAIEKLKAMAKDRVDAKALKDFVAAGKDVPLSYKGREQVWDRKVKKYAAGGEAKMQAGGIAKLAKLLKGAKGPQSEALTLAQQRAALPVSEGGLGLPANNTPMDRARAMGFDTNVYHGTTQDVPAFDISRAGSSTGHESAKIPAVWTTRRPEVANIFTAENVHDAYPVSVYGPAGGGLRSIRVLKTLEGGNVMPLMLRGTPEETLTAGQAQKLIFGDKGGDWRDAGGNFSERFNEKPVLTKIKGHPQAELEFRADQYVVPDPSMLRSRFAAFDPFRKDVATAAAMGVAAPNLLAKEQKKSKEQKKAAGGAVHMADGGKVDKPYIGYRRAGRRPESQQDRAASANIPVAVARGLVSGSLGMPADLLNLPGAIYSGITGKESYELPFGSEYIEKRLPFRGASQTPVGQMFTGASQLAGGAYTGPLSGARAVMAVPKAIKRAGQDFVQAAGQPAVNVIKPKGGNWMSGSVEKALAPLKTQTIAGETPAQRIPRHEALLSDPSLNKDQIDRVLYHLEETKKEAALDQWIDRNLTNYIKKEMATPEDPVRKLAEQGIDPQGRFQYAPDRDLPTLQVTREEFGFPPKGMGQSPQAQNWEKIADETTQIETAGDIIAIAQNNKLYGDTFRKYKNILEENPWLLKVDPSTPVYSPKAGNWSYGDTGFDHIVDVLKQDLASGRIRPDQLNKVSMEQAVRRTYDFDQDMAKKMREAQIKATEGMPVHKEYPEGYKWIELTAKYPEQIPEGFGNVQNFPKAIKAEKVDAPGTFVHGADMNDLIRGIYKNFPETKGNPEKALETALKYEGDTMGHCVGGYCPDVLEGRSRIYSLRDAKGEPHVTIEVNPSSQRVAPRHEEVLSEMKASGLDTNQLDELAYDIEYEQALQRVKQNRPPAIAQIKGKQNRAPNEEYLPFVQDFVRGGKWSDVGDLGNTGLYKADPESLGMFLPEDPRLRNLPGRRTDDFIKAQKAGLFGDNQYLTRKEFEDILRRQIESESGPLPPIEGMKAGGEVKMAGAGAAFGIYPKQRATPSSEETKKRVKQASEVGADLFLPKDAVDVGMMLLPGGKAARKLGAALIAGGASTEAEAGVSAIKAALAKLGKFATERDLKKIKDAGQAAYDSEAALRAAKDAEIAKKIKAMPARSKKSNIEMGLYHPVGGGAKLSKPFEAMHSTRVPNPTVGNPQVNILTPEDLYRQQAAMYPLVGDKADTGTFLTHIGKKELEVPVGLGGGPRYMDVNLNPANLYESAAWESGTGRVTSLGNQAQRAGESGRPVFGVYTAGSGTNTDFNIMGANAILQQIPQSKFTKKTEKAFDEEMRSIFSGWPGIRSEKAEDILLDKNQGELRKSFINLMGSEPYQKAGMPDVPATRKAIMDPQLYNTPTNESGFRIARMDPTGRIIENPLQPSDYPTAMAGELAGKLNQGVDYKDMFSSHFNARRLLGQPESGDYYSFSRAHPIQYADQEWLDRIMQAQEKKNKIIKTGSYAKGGKVGGLSQAKK